MIRRNQYGSFIADSVGRRVSGAACVLWLIGTTGALNAAEPPSYRLESVEILAEQQVRYLDDDAAAVTVITREELREFGAVTIEDALVLAAPTAIYSKGAPGSQADISIRGSSFEGVLVLIDGIRVHDPQTGHFTMDLPISLDQVSRIEIQSGGGSGIYGGAAPGGVINLVTGTSRPGLTGSISGGSHGLLNGSLTYTAANDVHEMSVTLTGSDTDGFRPGTDRNARGVAAQGASAMGSWTLKWNAGMQMNRFGADSFYGPYPSYEETTIFQGGVHLNRLIGSTHLLRLRIGSRGHDDRFVLIRDNPSAYQNTHFNRSTTVAAEYIAEPAPQVTLTTGTELERFGITSGSLGSRSDQTVAVYTQIAATFARASVSGALRIDTGYVGGTVLSPSIGVSIPLTVGLSARFKADRSFRPPTYTERFYSSPANIGDPDLEPEYTTGYEAGLTYVRGDAQLSGTLFHDTGTDVIDWIRADGETVWRVENHGEVVTRGIEAALRLPLGSGTNLRVSALMLEQEVTRQAGMVSKYALNPLETVFSAAFSHTFWRAATVSMTARHERQRMGSNRTPVSVGLAYQHGVVRYRIEADNVFDERYEVLPDLPAHGRWITFRLEYVK